MDSITTKQFLKMSGEDITVKKGGTRSTNKGRIKQSLFRVSIASFEDLTALRHIPPGLSEKEIIKALNRDDLDAKSITDRMMEVSIKRTKLDTNKAKLNPLLSYKHEYRQVRKTSNHNLISAITKVIPKRAQLDSVNIEIIANILDLYYSNRLKNITYLLAGNLTVERNSTFQITENVDALWANNIRIHRGGVITKQGSGIRINCRTIQGNI